jgi:hypothetical protein
MQTDSVRLDIAVDELARRRVKGDLPAAVDGAVGDDRLRVDSRKRRRRVLGEDCSLARHSENEGEMGGRAGKGRNSNKAGKDAGARQTTADDGNSVTLPEERAGW